mgnify:CR=1 FL=1
MKTEKIEFADGNWWEIRSGLTVGMAQAVDEAMRPYRKMTSAGGSADEILSGRAQGPQYDIDRERLDLEAINRALVLAATKSWSYAPGVNADVLRDEVPQDHYAQVLGRLQNMLLPLLGAVATPKP